MRPKRKFTKVKIWHHLNGNTIHLCNTRNDTYKRLVIKWSRLILCNKRLQGKGRIKYVFIKRKRNNLEVGTKDRRKIHRETKDHKKERSVLQGSRCRTSQGRWCLNLWLVVSSLPRTLSLPSFEICDNHFIAVHCGLLPRGLSSVLDIIADWSNPWIRQPSFTAMNRNHSFSPRFKVCLWQRGML